MIHIFICLLSRTNTEQVFKGHGLYRWTAAICNDRLLAGNKNYCATLHNVSCNMEQEHCRILMEPGMGIMKWTLIVRFKFSQCWLKITVFWDVNPFIWQKFTSISDECTACMTNSWTLKLRQRIPLKSWDTLLPCYVTGCYLNFVPFYTEDRGILFIWNVGKNIQSITV
jgi:hypothetical protein